jgi:hypothetical protein
MTKRDGLGQLAGFVRSKWKIPSITLFVHFDQKNRRAFFVNCCMNNEKKLKLLISIRLIPILANKINFLNWTNCVYGLLCNYVLKN